MTRTGFEFSAFIRVVSDDDLDEQQAKARALEAIDHIYFMNSGVTISLDDGAPVRLEPDEL